MRSPAHLRQFRRDEAGNSALESIHSSHAVLWQVGLALAGFLGLAAVVSAVLTSTGVN